MEYKYILNFFLCLVPDQIHCHTLNRVSVFSWYLWYRSVY